MKLKLLIEKMEIVKIIGNLPDEIVGITDVSYKTQKNWAFFCIKGNSNDGRNFIKEVELLGASVIITEREISTSLCQIVVKDVRKELALCSREFYGNPQEDLRVIAIVGTNGKTSVSHILASLFASSGYNVGVTGTIGTYFSGKVIESSLTTLGSVEFFKLIKNMADEGVEILIMELSAHAIEQKRCEGVFFDALIFTNCTEDHLDYFKTMEEYERVKRSVFNFNNCKYMIINSDDETGRKIINDNDGKVITYGIENPADVFAINVEETVNGVSFVINLYDLIYGIDCGLYGICNVYNILAASACAAVFGIKIHTISLALKNLKPISGRAEPVSEFNGATVFIDYAHTPDGLKRTLLSMRKICKGKLICLFGCGGNREKEKRPIMGSISGSISDYTIITSDNPRYEDGISIIKDVESGIKKVTQKYITISDRRAAICYSLDLLRAGDILLIAGKGAEKYQEIMGEKRFFSDKKIVLEYVAEGRGDKDY